ncbi:uncharacterized protein LOC34622252 [Cyclospora cayetanensis]|uniref:Uncharacterized protein LOC34622252 n=1 Tax=Cyclospora cayetanensis TaxID=88456 RepID=A0A6P6RTN4_9EIME|nr:uncharacterized protein LOC34622252 [Cyclospora cayetanensis]
MRRYASLFVIAACICAGSSADDDDDYSPPVPLREAVTASVEPTDISDSSLTETPALTPAEAGKTRSLALRFTRSRCHFNPTAERLRQEAITSQQNEDEDDDDSTNSNEDAFATEAKISDITKLSKGSVRAPSVAALDAEISETTENIKAPKRIQSRKHRVTDVIDEIMGGEFNTEVNQRMADSFLSARPHFLRSKANRDL